MSAPACTCARDFKPAHSFHCTGCGVGLAAKPPRGSTSAKLDAWFASHGWDATSGRPRCRACKPAEVRHAVS